MNDIKYMNNVNIFYIIIYININYININNLTNKYNNNHNRITKFDFCND